ncbi:CopG family transcriptional regulator [Steroidobacter flavus]|uniref:CopG family transcriptional regulator n=1 Tax=Steroidobacter flavus TaxID=1842136 RepID=A0ABV8SRQ3_9GAMM
MAEKQNITVAIEPALLKQARAIAARRGTSISGLLADELRRLVAADRTYEKARKRALELMKTGLGAMASGRMENRDEIHDRSRFR